MGLKTVGRVEKEGKLHEILLSTSGKFLDGMMLTIQGATEELAGADSRPADLGTLIFMTADNEAIAKRLRRAGVEITVRDPQHLISQDPDGYRLMIYQFDSRMLNSKP